MHRLFKSLFVFFVGKTFIIVCAKQIHRFAKLVEIYEGSHKQERAPEKPSPEGFRAEIVVDIALL